VPFLNPTIIHDSKNGMATPPPTQETFDKLLLCLNSDRERAGDEYELLRLKLLEYFRSRTCLGAEELADETLNRLAKKIAEGEEVRDILRYNYGLARWVWVEYVKRPGVNQVSFDDSLVGTSISPDSLLEKERQACFQYCLRELTDRERELIVGYWDHENQTHRDARREMAERLQISLTALRIRVSRIKSKLEACFSRCLEQGLPKLK
jgi:DNA-directed RNA polymerase specialized sigma24 family protein